MENNIIPLLNMFWDQLESHKCEFSITSESLFCENSTVNFASLTGHEGMNHWEVFSPYQADNDEVNKVYNY